MALLSNVTELPWAGAGIGKHLKGVKLAQTRPCLWTRWWRLLLVCLRRQWIGNCLRLSLACWDHPAHTPAHIRCPSYYIALYWGGGSIPGGEHAHLKEMKPAWTQPSGLCFSASGPNPVPDNDCHWAQKCWLTPGIGCCPFIFIPTYN